MCRLDRSPRHQRLVPGSCPMLPGRYLKTCRNTVRLVYSMHSSTEHRKAPVCGDESKVAHPGVTWEKMMYHSSSPGLRQTQVHRSRQSHIRIRPAAGVRARTRGVGEQRREGVVVHQGDSRCIVAHARHPAGRVAGPGWCWDFWWWRGGGARMAGLLISSGPLGAEQPWAVEEVLFTVCGFSIVQCPIYLSVCLCVPPSLHCGVMTAGCGTGLTGQTDSGGYGAPPCWAAGGWQIMTEPSRGRRRAQTLRPTPEPLGCSCGLTPAGRMAATGR